MTGVRRITGQEFTRLVELFSGTVFRTAMCYVKNHADADDIMQDVFLKLYTYDKAFETDEHAKAWLIRVTANMCRNLLKIHKRKSTLPIETAADIKAPEEKGGALLEIIMKMKAKNRFVLYMHYFEGCTTKEIADIMGIKENAVTSQLYRGRKQLKELLLKEGYDELQ